VEETKKKKKRATNINYSIYTQNSCFLFGQDTIHFFFLKEHKIHVLICITYKLVIKKLSYIS